MKFAKVIKSALPVAVVGFLALGLTSTPVFAASATANFAVSATVAANCTITTTALAFGSYTGAAISTPTGTVSVTCTNTTPYTVALSAGAATGATVTNRSMTGPGSALLNYGLYSDSARTLNFATTASITGSGVAQPITVYGQVPAAQYVTPGSYTDSVVATVSY